MAVTIDWRVPTCTMAMENQVIIMRLASMAKNFIYLMIVKFENPSKLNSYVLNRLLQFIKKYKLPIKALR